jgi:hypothetical protein
MVIAIERGPFIPHQNPTLPPVLIKRRRVLVRVFARLRLDMLQMHHVVGMEFPQTLDQMGREHIIWRSEQQSDVIVEPLVVSDPAKRPNLRHPLRLSSHDC